MRRHWLISIVCAAGLALAGCGGEAEAPAEGAAGAADGPAGVEGTATAPGTVDLADVPVSQAPLGAFPYLALPDGYLTTVEEAHDYASFPFWVNGAFRTVEGRTWMSTIEADEDAGKTYSRLELLRNMEHALTRAGGVRLSESAVPSEAYNALPDEVISAASNGLGDIYNDPVATWVVRRPDKVIWVHLTSGGGQGALTVVETAPFVATAGLLPAEELGRQIEADGRVAIQVNFAVDRAEILPESRGQLDAVVELLRARPGWRLSVEGHTDATGSAAHNRTLSEARARSVTAALTAAGIAADRLEARGFGPDRPVADNATEDGRAQNRRVELVRL